MLERDIRKITRIPYKKIIFGDEERERFEKETKCWLCKGEIVDVKNCKVKGKFVDVKNCKVKGEFDDVKNCKVKREFVDVKNCKVRDHCHFTCRYRGAAHKICNLKFRKPNFMPVVFHNLSGYDSHLFIKSLGFTDGNIDCIPNNEERYISFTKTIQVGSYKKKV